MVNKSEQLALYEKLLFIESTEQYVWCGLGVPIILGNLITVAAVWKDYRLHTASNFLVTALAMSDLLVGVVGMIRATISKTVTMCSIPLTIFKIFMHQVPVICTMALLLLIAVDRFVAIIYPLHYDQYITMRNVKIMVLVSCCSVTLFCSSYFVWAFVGDQSCATFQIPPGHIHPLTMGLYGCIALCLFTIYFKIHLIAQKHRRQIEDSSRRHDVDGTEAKKRSKKRTTKMFIVIIIIYLIFWSPYAIMTVAGTAKKSLAEKYTVIIMACRSAFRCLGYCNSGVNIFVYAWANKDFRRAYSHLLCWERTAVEDGGSLGDTSEGGQRGQKTTQQSLVSTIHV